MRDVLARLAALAVAVGLVLGALTIRGALDDDGTRPGPDGGAAPTGGEDGDTAPLDLRCIDELAEVCGPLAELAERDGAVTSLVGSAGDTARTFRAATEPLAAGTVWVTLSPWPGIVNEARIREGREPVLGAVSEPVARSPLVLVGWRERLAVLDESCGGAAGWGCLGDVADGTWAELGGDPRWGPVKPGHLPPDSSAVGLLVAGQAAADRTGGAGFSLRDLQDDGFRSWFSDLERAVPSFEPSAGTPLRQMLQFGVASYDVVGTLEAEPAALFPVAGARAEGLDVRYPQPMLVADLVLGGGDADAVERVRRLLTSAEGEELLRAAGWRLPDGAPPATRPDAPPLDEAQLPAPGALEALQTVWAEVVR